MNVHVIDSTVVMAPREITDWSNTGTHIVVGNGKAWPAADWRELAELWAKNVDRRAIDALFLERGYHQVEIDLMRALLYQNPFILPPIERALVVLGGLGRRDDRAAGGFTLHGHPARTVDVIRFANRILYPLALSQIRYPSAAGCEA